MKWPYSFYRLARFCTHARRDVVTRVPHATQTSSTCVRTFCHLVYVHSELTRMEIKGSKLELTCPASSFFYTKLCKVYKFLTDGIAEWDYSRPNDSVDWRSRKKDNEAKTMYMYVFNVEIPSCKCMMQKSFSI